MMPTVADTKRTQKNELFAEAPLAANGAAEGKALPLVRKLCQLMATEQINYCHWKSNNALDRSASGENDLDLLVSQADGPRFEAMLRALGFKQVKAPADKEMPGVLDYFGYEPEADKFVHVHLHYHLVVGHDASKNYRLPIEQAYLASATDGDLFRVPAVEYEFVVFVIRMVLKHLTWDLLLGGEGKLKSSEARELEYLLTRINHERVYDILTWHLPQIDFQLFDQCVEALQHKCPTSTRISIGQQLHKQLQANARRHWSVDLTLKIWRRFAIPVRRRLFKGSTKYRLQSNTTMIALVGGDGAGKTTAVKALHRWLSKYFETTQIHMGKPAWSFNTRLIRAMLKVGQLLGFYPVESSMRETIHQRSRVSPGYPWLIREVCLARDRYNTYVKAKRFARRGGVAIIDRYPLPQQLSMDGPQTERFLELLSEKGPHGPKLIPTRESKLVKALVKMEARYYQRINAPDLLIVLRVEPEVAVRRKTDEESTMVRERSSEVWQAQWDRTDALVIDSSKPLDVVLRELKSYIWSKL